MGGDWSELNSTQDINKFIFGTKADTLARLESVIRKSSIGSQISFTVGQWKDSPENILQRILKKFGRTQLVVRSSSAEEDNWRSSNAGGFESVLGVQSINPQEVTEAIGRVIKSYGSSCNCEDQILIQEQLHDVHMAGVVFTCSMENGAPYYRFNFDDSSKTTDSVTAGNKADLRTVILYKSEAHKVNELIPELSNVLLAVQEIEELLSFDKLDIEFAVDERFQVHIFQVRPIVVNHESFEIIPEKIAATLKNSAGRFEELQTSPPHIVGERALFANMPDWNPAEIIGTRPKPLALSLYQFLITDEIWAHQRSEFGYKNVDPAPLISTFCGQPYVDVRASLNSFLPEELPSDTSERLINAYITLLDNHKHLHDKLEFEIAFTAWVPNFYSLASARLAGLGVLHEDIVLLEEALRKITERALLRLEKDIESVERLENRRNEVSNSNIPLLDKIYYLLTDCRSLGTLPFAHAARSGFVARTLLESLVDSGALTRKRFTEFMNSFKTVTGEFEIDKSLYASGEVSKDYLIEKYGHLRPGTYEIGVRAYWEDPELYLLASEGSGSEHYTSEFRLSGGARGCRQYFVWLGLQSQ